MHIVIQLFLSFQVKSGTIFDNVLITDDVKEAEENAKVWEATKTAEKKMKDEQDEEERKQREAEEAAKKAEEGIVSKLMYFLKGSFQFHSIAVILHSLSICLWRHFF